MFETILHHYRSQYLALRSALPWLDASYYPDEKPDFDSFALPGGHAIVKGAVLKPDSMETIRPVQTESEICLWRWLPSESGPLSGLESLIGRLCECKLPLIIRQTDLAFHELEQFALSHPRLAVILESGPRKLLYHIHHIEAKMLKCANLYLSTYNFCNWLGLERFKAKGLLPRLLFGSHAPRFSPDAAMGPIIMGDFSWEEKCALAGNNLRRLLSIPIRIHPPQEYELDGAAGDRCPTFSDCLNPLVGRGHPCPATSNFIIDAHAHNVMPGSRNLFGFPTPDEDFTSADWIANMDRFGIERSFLIPNNALVDKNISAKECVVPLLEYAPERIRYLSVFHPSMNKSQCARVAGELAEPSCVGLKIHPAFHKLEADHPDYAKAFSLAGRAGKPVVTHSWEISDYNPVQQLAHPDRFRKHLADHPDVTLVLGHAGGRPSALDAVVELCREFPKTAVDVSGDYFDNGVIDCLADRLGSDRIMFGSDADWIDPRCNLGPMLVSRLPDKNALKILRENAQRIFLRQDA